MPHSQRLSIVVGNTTPRHRKTWSIRQISINKWIDGRCHTYLAFLGEQEQHAYMTHTYIILDTRGMNSQNDAYGLRHHGWCIGDAHGSVCQYMLLPGACLNMLQKRGWSRGGWVSYCRRTGVLHCAVSCGFSIVPSAVLCDRRGRDLVPRDEPQLIGQVPLG